MLETEEKEIDGIWFKYQPMMLKDSRRMFDGLAQRFGPAIASAIEGLDQAEIDMDMKVNEMLGGVVKSAGGLLRGFVAGLDPSYHEQVANQLAKGTEYQNESGNYVPLDNNTRETMFGAKLLTETKLIIWCLSVQYSDFLEPLQQAAMTAVSLRGMALSALESRGGSIGSHTGSPRATDTATA